MQRRAFTLLELMIVVIIVGILASLAIPMFQGATIKARITEIFVVADFFDKVFDMLIAQYGSNDLDFVYAELYKEKIAESLISTQYFNYFTYVSGSGYIGIQARPWHPSGDSKFLVERKLYPDKKTWRIFDESPWAKYLNIPGAEHYP